MAINQAKGTS